MANGGIFLLRYNLGYMDNTFLENYYLKVILPQYSTEDFTGGVAWKDHGKVGLDTWAHYFDDSNGREFVLIYEDFPGSEYLADDLTHDIVLCQGDSSLQASLSSGKLVENVVGYFTLYKERGRS